MTYAPYVLGGLLGLAVLLAIAVIIGKLLKGRSAPSPVIDRSDPNKIRSSNLPEGVYLTIDDCDYVPIDPELRRFDCGHQGPQKFVLVTYGEISKEIDDPEYCPDCVIKIFKKDVIRCALCRGPIFPGQGVALYGLGSSGLHTDIATYADDSQQSVLGCLKMDCCPSGGFYAGHWTVSGFKPEFENGNTAAGECLTTGKAVIANP